MANITLKVDGEDEFNRTFARVDAVFSDLTPIWPDVRDKFWAIEKDQFESEGGAGRSGAWRQLNERYKAEKIKRYGAGLKILQATGDMMKSLTGQTENTIYRTSKDEVVIGTSLARAMYHHRGGPKLPKREIISFADEQKNELTKTIQAALVRELRQGKGYIPVSERVF